MHKLFLNQEQEELRVEQDKEKEEYQRKRLISLEKKYRKGCRFVLGDKIAS